MDPESIARFLACLRPSFEEGDDTVGNKAVESACVEVLERQYQAIARGDFDGFLDTLDEEIDLEISGPSTIPFVGRWRGRQEVVEAVRQNFGYVEDQRPEIKKVVAQGDTVVVSARERGRFRPTGRTYDIHWVQFFTIKNGRITRIFQVFDSAPLVEAVQGPSELLESALR